jgi:hypothetical protein
LTNLVILLIYSAFLCSYAGIVFEDGSGERDFLKDLGGMFISLLNIRVK